MDIYILCHYIIFNQLFLCLIFLKNLLRTFDFWGIWFFCFKAFHYIMGIQNVLDLKTYIWKQFQTYASAEKYKINICIIIMFCMCGQKVMNGTVANALRVYFLCTRGSLRSLTPGDREGGVFPASHTWSWRGRSLSCLSHPCEVEGGLSDRRHLKIEGELSSQSLLPWSGG